MANTHPVRIKTVDGWQDLALTGPGVAPGGTAGQILSKIDATNFNTQWINAPSGGGGAPSGPAGGVLGGTYPNPTFAVDMATQAEQDAAIATVNTSLGNKVDKDSVVAAATRIVASKLLAGDAQPAFQINGDGKIQWGPGGASGGDASLYRFSTGYLRNSGAGFATDGELYVDYGGAGKKLFFGPAADTNLYRLGPGALKTDGALHVANTVYESGNTNGFVYNPTADPVGFVAFGILKQGAPNWSWSVNDYGQIQWGPNGSAERDTNLYRSGAGALKTDGQFYVQGGQGFDLFAVSNAAYLRGAIVFHDGTDYSLTLKRQSGGILQLDGGALQITHAWGLALQSDYGSGLGIRFGASLDTNLYRASAAVLKTDGTLSVVTALNLGNDDVTMYRGAAQRIDTNASLAILYGSLQFGSPPDTNLYRAGAGQLKTDGGFQVFGGLISKHDFTAAWFSKPADTGWRFGIGGDGKIFWHNGTDFGVGDTSLYRATAGQLKTDGGMIAQWYMTAPTSAEAWAAWTTVVGESQPRFLMYARGPLYWGDGVSAPDTNLYRGAAGYLYTDSSIKVFGGYLWLDPNNTGGYLTFGGSADVSLYRAGAGKLKTDGLLAGGYTTLAAGATITVSGNVHKITSGSGPISTINGGVAGAFVFLINGTAGSISTTNTGNIGIVVTIPSGGMRGFAFDGTYWSAV